MLVKPFELIPFASGDELARAVADAWLAEMDAAQRAGKPHHVALSGGRIAHKLFALVAERAKTRAPSFEHTHFFWADERCVPPDDPQSNFRLARELLFLPLAVPDSQVHRIHGEHPPEVAAAKAEAEIRGLVPLNDAGQPVLDLVLLGLGEDGHIASLFPNRPAEPKSSNAVYQPVENSPKPPPGRVTLGYRALAAARQAWVLVSGSGKEDALRQSLEDSGRTPLAELLKLRPHTRILSDVRLK